MPLVWPVCMAEQTVNSTSLNMTPLHPLQDVGTGAAVAVDTTGWEDCVVWNPWTTMKDCYERFVCVEQVRTRTGQRVRKSGRCSVCLGSSVSFGFIPAHSTHCFVLSLHCAGQVWQARSAAARPELGGQGRLCRGRLHRMNDMN